MGSGPGKVEPHIIQQFGDQYRVKRVGWLRAHVVTRLMRGEYNVSEGSLKALERAAAKSANLSDPSKYLSLIQSLEHMIEQHPEHAKRLQDALVRITKLNPGLVAQAKQDVSETEKIDKLVPGEEKASSRMRTIAMSVISRAMAGLPEKPDAPLRGRPDLLTRCFEEYLTTTKGLTQKKLVQIIKAMAENSEEGRAAFFAAIANVLTSGKANKDLIAALKAAVVAVARTKLPEYIRVLQTSSNAVVTLQSAFDVLALLEKVGVTSRSMEETARKARVAISTSIWKTVAKEQGGKWLDELCKKRPEYYGVLTRCFVDYFKREEAVVKQELPLLVSKMMETDAGWDALCEALTTVIAEPSWKDQTISAFNAALEPEILKVLGDIQKTFTEDPQNGLKIVTRFLDVCAKTKNEKLQQIVFKSLKACSALLPAIQSQCDGTEGAGELLRLAKTDPALLLKLAVCFPESAMEVLKPVPEPQDKAQRETLVAAAKEIGHALMKRFRADVSAGRKSVVPLMNELRMLDTIFPWAREGIDDVLREPENSQVLASFRREWADSCLAGIPGSDEETILWIDQIVGFSNAVCRLLPGTEPEEVLAHLQEIGAWFSLRLKDVTDKEERAKIWEFIVTVTDRVKQKSLVAEEAFRRGLLQGAEASLPSAFAVDLKNRASSVSTTEEVEAFLAECVRAEEAMEAGPSAHRKTLDNVLRTCRFSPDAQRAIARFILNPENANKIPRFLLRGEPDLSAACLNEYIMGVLRSGDRDALGWVFEVSQTSPVRASLQKALEECFKTQEGQKALVGMGKQIQEGIAQLIQQKDFAGALELGKKWFRLVQQFQQMFPAEAGSLKLPVIGADGESFKAFATYLKERFTGRSPFDGDDLMIFDSIVGLFTFSDEVRVAVQSTVRDLLPLRTKEERGAAFAQILQKMGLRGAVDESSLTQEIEVWKRWVSPEIARAIDEEAPKRGAQEPHGVVLSPETRAVITQITVSRAVNGQAEVVWPRMVLEGNPSPLLECFTEYLADPQKTPEELSKTIKAVLENTEDGWEAMLTALCQSCWPSVPKDLVKKVQQATVLAVDEVLRPCSEALVSPQSRDFGRLLQYVQKVEELIKGIGANESCLRKMESKVEGFFQRFYGGLHFLATRFFPSRRLLRSESYKGDDRKMEQWVSSSPSTPIKNTFGRIRAIEVGGRRKKAAIKLETEIGDDDQLFCAYQHNKTLVAYLEEHRVANPQEVANRLMLRCVIESTANYLLFSLADSATYEEGGKTHGFKIREASDLEKNSIIQPGRPQIRFFVEGNKCIIERAYPMASEYYDGETPRSFAWVVSRVEIDPKEGEDTWTESVTTKSYGVALADEVRRRMKEEGKTQELAKSEVQKELRIQIFGDFEKYSKARLAPEREKMRIRLQTELDGLLKQMNEALGRPPQ